MIHNDHFLCNKENNIFLKVSNYNCRQNLECFLFCFVFVLFFCFLFFVFFVLFCFLFCFVLFFLSYLSFSCSLYTIILFGISWVFFICYLSVELVSTNVMTSLIKVLTFCLIWNISFKWNRKLLYQYEPRVNHM